jgi:hypothetical protein
MAANAEVLAWRASPAKAKLTGHFTEEPGLVSAIKTHRHSRAKLAAAGLQLSN